MATDEHTVDIDQPEDLREMARRVRRERDERIAEIWERMPTLEVEPHPGLKRLVDTQDEYRERLEKSFDKIIGSSRF